MSTYNNLLLLCLDYTTLLFLLGFIGLLLNKRNLLLMLLSLELTFLSSALNFFFSSYLLNYSNGVIYGIFVFWIMSYLIIGPCINIFTKEMVNKNLH